MARARRRKLMWLCGGLLTVGILGVFGYTVTARPAAEVDPSRVAVVERGDLARSVVATGKIEPITKVEIKSKANGIIKDLEVDVGDLVAAGQVLAELDRDNLAARLREARAALNGAEASLRATEAELAKNRVEAEGPEAAFARRNLDRAERLAKDLLISPQGLDEARIALEQAVNRQTVARSHLGVSEARVAQARASVAQAQAAVDRAAEEYANATIRSPLNGIVLSRDVELGSPVSSILNLGASATLVMVLGDISRVYVRGKVDEADVGLVKLGQTARIRVETFKDRPFVGKVTQIAPMGVERDNVVSFEVRVSIDNATGELRANMTSNAEIVLEEHAGTLIVPERAVIYDAERRSFVERLAAGARTGRERVAVTLGISNGTRTEVVKGLRDGDRVVLQ